MFTKHWLFCSSKMTSEEQAEKFEGYTNRFHRKFSVEKNRQSELNNFED